MTHQYAEADLAMKKRVPGRLREPGATIQWHRAPDALIDFPGRQVMFGIALQGTGDVGSGFQTRQVTNDDDAYPVRSRQFPDRLG